MTFTFNDTPYYEQVHMALHGAPCPRIQESHGIDEDENGLSVSSARIKKLAGQDELDKALDRRADNFDTEFMLTTQKLHGVEFGLNRDLQKGISLGQDSSDEMFYIYHTSGCIVKIPRREVKKQVVPPPGLFDHLKENTESSWTRANENKEMTSAMWGEYRVFPTPYYMTSQAPMALARCFRFCRTEQPLYDGHDHECWIKETDLEC
jgi:hypothetical protein